MDAAHDNTVAIHMRADRAAQRRLSVTRGVTGGMFIVAMCLAIPSGRSVIGRIDMALAHLGSTNKELITANAQLVLANRQLADMHSQLSEARVQLVAANRRLDLMQTNVDLANRKIEQTNDGLAQTISQLGETNKSLGQTNAKLSIIDGVIQKLSLFRR